MESFKWKNIFCLLKLQCTDTSIYCAPCTTEYVNCYILDENGFVVVSDTHKHTGRFLGEIHGGMMDELVKRDVYERVTVVDYQAICHHLLSRPGAANLLLTVCRLFGLFFQR